MDAQEGNEKRLNAKDAEERGEERAQMRKGAAGEWWMGASGMTFDA